MKIIIINFCILITCACSSLKKTNFTPEQPHIKVTTYNVNYGARNVQNVLDAITKLDSDVVFLQETTALWHQQFASLKKSYPYQYFHFCGGAGGIAFISKTPLTNLKVIKNPHGWFPILTAELKTGKGMLQLVNVHLSPQVNNKGSISIGTFYKTAKIRAQEISYIQKMVPKNLPTIYAGDFNENDNKDAISLLQKQGFTDTLKIYDRSSPTWVWPLKFFKLKGRYDHILHSHHLKSSAAKVEHVNASDHHPVTSVILLPTD